MRHKLLLLIAALSMIQCNSSFINKTSYTPTDLLDEYKDTLSLSDYLVTDIREIKFPHSKYHSYFLSDSTFEDTQLAVNTLRRILEDDSFVKQKGIASPTILEDFTLSNISFVSKIGIRDTVKLKNGIVLNVLPDKPKDSNIIYVTMKKLPGNIYWIDLEGAIANAYNGENNIMWEYIIAIKREKDGIKLIGGAFIEY